MIKTLNSDVVAAAIDGWLASDIAEPITVAAEAAINKDKTFLTIWYNRPTSIKNDVISNNKNYGNSNLHYLLGMFGLTASFNDRPTTTLSLLKEKLQKVINFAKENEEFLANN